jgi:hypothetical protein
MKRLGRGSVWLALCACCVALPAAAKGWDPLEYTLRIGMFGTSDAFPGSLNSGPDQGIEPMGQIAAGRRLSRTLKLGLLASAGGNVQGEFTQGNYGWFTLGSVLRRNKTAFTLESQWTPKRNKFPTDPEEGGEFASRQVVAGVRQVVGTRLRLRLEGTLDRDKFVPQFAPRDTWAHEVFGSVTFTPVGRTDLHMEGSAARDDASDPRYDKTARWLGGGVAWSDSSWHTDVSARSGLRHYPGNVLGQSNFDRRDQWIELRLRLQRVLRPGLSTMVGASLVDQTSSRVDRNFTARTFTVGLEWTGGGK